ncbi:PKD domain-containing protein [Chitinophaga pinensis]|uniref:PKD domain-containing protein n=1 Tax=Chitinophaga pinensis TaxID=79329 RepID=A0A5C6LK98_9BACT|nr:PKD domain-containing protein [Chitinophaga pinensis]TWV95635.1 PKD domain-containing protein [Chitinophaga pinensis]
MRKVLLAATAIMLIISSCSKDDDVQQPPAEAPKITITTPDGGFAVDNRKWLKIDPVVVSDSAATTYTWLLNNDTISTAKNLLYAFGDAGTFTLTFTAKNSAGSAQQQLTVKVTEKTYTGKVKVFDYFPAPGQFTNGLPMWETGNTEQEMIAKAEDQLNSNGMISLGGFGGYVVLGTDHTIIRKEDEYDFLLKSNAFPNWSEAGIVMVAIDANGNGLPDDEWYEIAGSDYNSTETIHGYKITYYKPDENKEQKPDGMYMLDTTYILWKDNQGQSGFLSKNVFNTGPYYPQWKGDSISFTGTLLTSKNIEDQSGNGTYFVSKPFAWGYADNVGDAEENSAIKISWAVDKNGNRVKLPGIDFIKVHTGMRAEAGWLGEISTEVTGLLDLHLKK